MPSKESLERSQKFLGNQPEILITALTDLLDEAIREARLAEAEWWRNTSGDQIHTTGELQRERLAQLREGKP